MNRPVFGLSGRSRCGFTLIEVLVAVTLTMIMMAAVVQIFAIVGQSINNSRSTLEMSERLRATANRLRLDLEGATADMTPPARPEDGRGYFEYVEGPVGIDPTVSAGKNTDEANAEDFTVGDIDDILQFTTRSDAEPFLGRALVIDTAGTPAKTVIKSQAAEVAWFLRGTTLYRRVLLVSPSFDADLRTPEKEAEVVNKRYVFLQHPDFRHKNGEQIGFYNNYDLSVHWDVNQGKIVCNTLSDLTRRECRFAHPPLSLDGTTSGFPHALHLTAYGQWYYLGLPILQECSHSAWPFPINGRIPYRSNPGIEPAVYNLTATSLPFDAWVNTYPFEEIDKDTGAIKLNISPSDYPPNPPPAWPGSVAAYIPPLYLGPRVAEDVILTNVLSFDVKAWDPEAPVVLSGNNALLPGDVGYLTTLPHASLGAYVDLGYATTVAGLSHFSGMPTTGTAIDTALRIYDTWSTHYEHDGVDQDGLGVIDQGTDGFDNNADGVVDDPGEREAPPPYDKPLRGIQVKIRTFDPDSRQVREVTIRHDFLKK